MPHGPSCIATLDPKIGVVAATDVGLSVGFGPVFRPPFWPGCLPNPKRRATNLSGRLPQDDPKACPGGVPTPPPLAIRAGVASRLRRFRSQSAGESMSQGMPLLRMKTMSARAHRSSTRGLPLTGLGGSGGKSGPMISQSSSLANSLAMFRTYPYTLVFERHSWQRIWTLSEKEDGGKCCERGATL